MCWRHWHFRRWLLSNSAIPVLITNPQMKYNLGFVAGRVARQPAIPGAGQGAARSRAGGWARKAQARERVRAERRECDFAWLCTSTGAGAGGDAGGRGGATSGGRRRWNLPPRPANSYRPRVSRSPSPDTGLLEAATRVQHEAHGHNRWGRDGWGPESAMGRGKGKGRERDERARAEARAALAANGRDHLKLKVEFLGAVRDEDMREFMKVFAVDKIVRDDEGIYVTFTDGGTARRAERVLGGRAAMLGFHAVTLSVHPAPAAAAAAGPVMWDDKTLVKKGICEDDEDIYAKLVLSSHNIEPNLDLAPLPMSETAPFFRKHITSSARTEGFYKITHAEKIVYITQYQARAKSLATAAPVDEPPLQHVESSRSNRANARRRAQGLEEINQVQRAVALSKGKAAANELNAQEAPALCALADS
ncbi:hypothetical protein B0H14DRAFT_3769636 [Mycena olivaceomarginata]|nr:hypothetical protein B0H14DRAFT_3769636 [Mycena olivaceomarginata]